VSILLPVDALQPLGMVLK